MSYVDELVDNAAVMLVRTESNELLAIHFERWWLAEGKDKFANWLRYDPNAGAKHRPSNGVEHG